MSRHEALVGVLCRQSELTLTKRVLLPLMKAIGWSRVEYSGGKSEEGKDIVCWRRDELDQWELGVAQVKLFKPTRRASDTKSLQTLLNQLSQASEKPLPHPDTQALHYPAVVYLITPFPVEIDILKAKFELLAAMRRCRLKIVDGHKLAELVDEKMKPLASTLLGVGGVLTTAMQSMLTNELLLRALELETPRPVETIYTDIDLALGQFSSRLLFRAHFSARRAEKVKLPCDQWRRLLEAADALHEAFGVEVLHPPTQQVADSFEEQQAKFDKWQAGREELVKDLCAAERDEESALSRLTQTLENLRARSHSVWMHHRTAEEIVANLNRLDQNRRALATRTAQAPTDEVVQRIVVLESEARELGHLLGGAETLLKEPLSAANASTLQKKNAQVALETWLEKEPLFEVTLDAQPLADELERQRRRLSGLLKELRGQDGSPVEPVRNVLEICQTPLRALRLLARIPELVEALGVSVDDDSRSMGRLDIGVQTALDCGLNTLILGEAGAGKTTSLQMYAHRKLASGRASQLVLFIPMARLWRSVDGNTRDGQEGSDEPRLLSAICESLKSLGVELDVADLRSELRRGAIVLVDGIDETLDHYPEISKELDALAARYPLVQWVASARTSGNLNFDLDFVPITLLPFSNRQRDHFVSKWFDDSAPAAEVLAHLATNPEVAEIVRNPLLITILCVLAGHSIPLPNTEMRLHSDRIDLLTGRYDLYKEVIRVKTRQADLTSLARGLAFKLHSGRRREEALGVLEDWAVRILGGKVGEAGARRALAELIDPCNLLLRATLDGKFGFGHLQHQEYLAACELLENRSVDISPFLSDNWWDGVLLFLARMSRSLSWLVERVRADSADTTIPQIVRRMVENGPENQRDGLLWLLDDIERTARVRKTTSRARRPGDVELNEGALPPPVSGRKLEDYQDDAMESEDPEGKR